MNTFRKFPPIVTLSSSLGPWPLKCLATRCKSTGSQANFSKAMEGTSRKSCSTPPGHGTMGQAQLNMLNRVRVHKQCITCPNLGGKFRTNWRMKFDDFFVSWLSIVLIQLTASRKNMCITVWQSMWSNVPLLFYKNTNQLPNSSIKLVTFLHH